VAGAWEVVRESNDLALYLTNRGVYRENFWRKIPAPRTPKMQLQKGHRTKNSDPNEGSMREGGANGFERRREDDEVSVDSADSEGGGGSVAESIGSAHMSLEEGGEGVSDRGIPDPNNGPDRAQWAHLLNVSAFIQPHSSAFDSLTPAPREHSAELRDLRRCRGSHWTALLSSIGAMPLWVPLSISCSAPVGEKYKCQLEVTIHVHARHLVEGLPKTAQHPSSKAAKNRMSKIGHLFVSSSETARVEDETFDIEV
jgi:hypothetical protein